MAPHPPSKATNLRAVDRFSSLPGSPDGTLSLLLCQTNRKDDTGSLDPNTERRLRCQATVKVILAFDNRFFTVPPQLCEQLPPRGKGKDNFENATMSRKTGLGEPGTLPFRFLTQLVLRTCWTYITI